MKFLANLCISPRTVRYLRKLGFEIYRVNEVGLARAKDREILNYAVEENMILITMDLDVGYLLAYTRRNKPSVILFRLRNPSVENINRLLPEVIETTRDHLEKGAIIVVEDWRIRIRELPISE